jgi:transposase
MSKNRRTASAKPVTTKDGAERVVKDIRRTTRKIHNAEEKIRIVLAGLRGRMERGRAIGSSGHATIAELCRREGIAQSLYHSWSKEFLGEA